MRIGILFLLGVGIVLFGCTQTGTQITPSCSYVLTQTPIFTGNIIIPPKTYILNHYGFDGLPVSVLCLDGVFADNGLGCYNHGGETLTVKYNAYPIVLNISKYPIYTTIPESDLYCVQIKSGNFGNIVFNNNCEKDVTVSLSLLKEYTGCI